MIQLIEYKKMKRCSENGKQQGKNSLTFSRL